MSPSVAHELLGLLVGLVPDGAVQHDLGAVALVAAIFDGVAFVAMQTTARMPWILAASATPCA